MSFPARPFLAALTWTAVVGAARAQDPLVPFAPGSRWSTQHLAGGAVTAAGRAGEAIGLEGTGGGLTGDGGKAAAWHKTGEQFSRTITARLASLEGADGDAEAGVWLSQPGGQSGSVGMRVIYRPDGSLRWEAVVYTEPPSSGGPINGLTLPLWLRVKFYQGGLQAYYSPDGVGWTALAPEPLPVTMPPNAYPALLVSSRGHAAPAKARFDNVAIVDGDADENGILDGWEMENFQHLLGSETGLDPDGDGSTNMEEWLWGTQPRVPTKKPALVIEPASGGRVRVSLSAPALHPPQTVGFQSSTSLQGPWSPLAPDPGLPFGVFIATAPVEPPARFFRAVALQHPYEDPSPGGPEF